MPTATPDLFTNVHKGIRRALFDACSALGRAEGSAERDAAARVVLARALRFVSHHGENEDLLLLPLLQQSARTVFDRMTAAHASLESKLKALTSSVESAPVDALYALACDFTALYLEHMREEEHVLEPLIRAAVPAETLALFGRRSVERTAPADQRMMLGWMLPAMSRPDADAFLAKLPPGIAEELRPLAA